MKSKFSVRTISIILCVLIIISTLVISISSFGAAVLPDGYEDDFEREGKTYENMGILEDQYDLIEPVNDRYPVISPNSGIDASYPPMYIGSYKQVQDYFDKNGMTDGMSIIPPTKLKAEKFIQYSSYAYNDVVATIDNKDVKTYMVAANAIMAGCAPEHLPVCIAFVQALSDIDYLNSLKSGNLTPMMYVNGPIARQIGIDCTQGMTSEETNFSIGRFMELALINFADIKRDNAFGYIQPLVFSENEEVCLNIGWKPHHVEQGYNLNDNVITATSFSMWGNNITPATDLPDEIMKVLAWDITEKNLTGLGSASVKDNANAKRLIFITESVATALAAKYKSKDALENALVQNARRPLWMRAFAYYYADTDGALSNPFNLIYEKLKDEESEDAKSTASPAWMNGITFANIDTVATMKKGNTNIIITGDSSRNKTQVMPGGMSVSKKVTVSDKWDSLLTSMNFNPMNSFYLEDKNHTITPPISVPSVLSNGDYRIIDFDLVDTQMTRKGRVSFDKDTNTLHYYANNGTGVLTTTLDPDNDASFINYLNNLGFNSSFTVSNGKMTAAIIRFSSNAKKSNNNTVALTKESFSNMTLTIHANNTQNSAAAGGIASDNSTVVLSDTITSFNANLDGTILKGGSTDNDFLKLNGSTVTINPKASVGATTIIGSANSDGTYRTMTFVNGGDGTYTITYNTVNTLSLDESPYLLKGTFNNWEGTDSFSKTSNNDIISIKKELSEGKYEFKINKSGIDEWYGSNESASDINDTVNRTTLIKGNTGKNVVLNASGGEYEFKYEISTKKLSVFHASSSTTEPTIQPTTIPTEKPTVQPSTASSSSTLGDGYYLVGKLNGKDCWDVNSLTDNKKFTENKAASGEYMLNWTFVSNDTIKVAKVENGAITQWFKDGTDNEYKISSGEVGNCTVYFRPNGNNDWTYTYIYVAKNQTPTESTFKPTETVKPTESTAKPTELPTSETHKETYILGDGNDNGKVDISDATIVQLLLARLISDDEYISQRISIIDKNGYSISDATVIQQYLAKLPTEYDDTIGKICKYNIK